VIKKNAQERHFCDLARHHGRLVRERERVRVREKEFVIEIECSGETTC